MTDKINTKIFIEDNLENIQFITKIHKIIESSIKGEFLEHLEISSLFRIKKNLLPVFENKKNLYSLEIIQDGTKNNIKNNCVLITVKDSLVTYYYELKKYNNKEILNNFYETLLMFEDFLNNLDKYFDDFSFEEKYEILYLIKNIYDNVPLLVDIIKNVSIKPIKKNKKLTDEDFNKGIDNILNKFEYIIRKKYDYKGGANFILILFRIFNIILLKNNYNKYLMPQFMIIPFSNVMFNQTRMFLYLPEYIPHHIQYIYFSFDENHMKNYKEFMKNWYDKFDKKLVKKTFIETKYKVN